MNTAVARLAIGLDDLKEIFANVNYSMKIATELSAHIDLVQLSPYANIYVHLKVQPYMDHERLLKSPDII